MNEELENTVVDDSWDDVDLSDVDLTVDNEPTETENKEVDTPVETENKEDVEETKEEKTDEVKEPEFNLDITVNGKKESLTKEQAVEFAQKGKDYDRIRPVYDFVKDLADQEGLSVDEYVKTTSDNLKDYKIKQLAEEKGISEEVAKELYESRVQKQKSLASENELKAKNEAENKRNAEFQDFMKAYPNVEAKDIPQSVWQEVQNGTPLKYAYQGYELAQIKNENQILKTNAKNKEQEITTGSAANEKAKDEFELAWEEALNS